MGEVQGNLPFGQDEIIRPSFNRSIHLEARSEQASADTGLLLLRELMERTGVVDWLDREFVDRRTQDLITHPMPELLRTQLLLLMQGWTNADDADWLRDEPLFRLAVSDRKGESPLLPQPDEALIPDGLASQPTLSRLLAQAARPENRAVLQEALDRAALARCRLIDRRVRHEHLNVDVDSLPAPVHGQQAGTAYNGYYHMRGFHPLVFGSGQTGEFYGAVLRPGNVHSSKGVLEPLLERLDGLQAHLTRSMTVRFDSGLVSDEVLTALEQRPHTSYVACIDRIAPLERQAQPYIQAYQRDLAAGQAPTDDVRCHELTHQADTWSRPRRIVLVLTPSQEDELPIAQHFFLVTDYPQRTAPGPVLVDLYRERGCFEAMLAELNTTLDPELSSTVRPKDHYRGRQPRQRTASRDAFAANEALWLFNLLAYNLLHIGRQAAERARVKPGRPKIYGRSSPGMSLNTFRQRHLKLPARIVRHSRQVGVIITDRIADEGHRLWRVVLNLEPVKLVF